MAGKLHRGHATYGDPILFGEENDVYIGKYCSIALNVIMDCGLNHNYNNITTYPFNAIHQKYRQFNTHPTSRGDIRIGNDVWIGRDAIIMSGVTVGDGAVIGARAMVTKDVEPYSIVVGVAAKHIKYRFDKDSIDFLVKTKWWDMPDEDVDKIVPYLMSNDMEGFKKYMGFDSEKLHRGYRVAIVTRSMNDSLYNMMKSRIDSKFDFIRITDCHGAEGASKYLYKIVALQQYDWVINIDEDFFTYDFDKIISLLEHMIDNNYHSCGMPDGGVCKHRFHSPIVTNPFFNIFNTKEIRKALDSIEYVESTFKYSDDMYKFMPNNIKKDYIWNNDNYEPYYPFFYWLPSRGFNVLYLDSYEHIDDISTILKNHVGDEIGIHTWYTREYNKDNFHTNRINSAYNLSKNK